MINARSPYIVTIDQVGSNITTVELFIYNQGGVAGANPDYVLSKKIPAVNLTETKYNVSPFLLEVNTPLITAGEPLPYWSGYFAVLKRSPDDAKRVEIVKYYDATLIGSEIKNISNGWGYFETGVNPDYETGTGRDAGTVCLDEGTYYYLLSCTNPTTTPDTNPLYRFPYIDAEVGEDWTMKITNLADNSSVSDSLSLYEGLRTSFRHSVFSSSSVWYGRKFKIEFIDKTLAVKWTGYFYPMTEPKYTPYVCDFINKYGSWQRTWFFKASKQSFEVTNEEYKGLDGTYTTFNTNAKKTLTVNTGWVDEAYNETVLKQLMLSEDIRINNERVKLKSKNVNLLKHINDNTINYTIDFDYSFDVLNTIAL